jgi:hypothetical protein
MSILRMLGADFFQFPVAVRRSVLYPNILPLVTRPTGINAVCPAITPIMAAHDDQMKRETEREREYRFHSTNYVTSLLCDLDSLTDYPHQMSS